MEHCIYHSRDLDGLTSGAIIYNAQTSFGEDCFLTGYDYGQKLDTRTFKGKSTIMIDVSMPMDRMELLGKNCMEFIWVDHHLSAYNQLHKYCEERGYKMTKNKYNDHIERIEVNSMNMIYFYSAKISACEMTSVLYGKHLSKDSKKLVSLLGQYDTWRDTEDKKFVLDEDWEKVVLPAQYYMRTCATPQEVNKIFRSINEWNGTLEISDIVKEGESILKYQKNVNDAVVKNNFDFELYGLNVIALNTTAFNSMSFEGYYHHEIHDAMMPFCYNGKEKKWMFSLYTTKEDVNILDIAQRFGGGGHSKACGFSLDPDFVNVSENTIEFGDFNKSQYVFADSKEVTPSLFKKEKPSKKGHVHRELDGIDYLITNLMTKQFDEMVNGDREVFDNHFSKFIVQPKTD